MPSKETKPKLPKNWGKINMEGAKEFGKKFEALAISLCPHCHCMTKKINGKCGKCGNPKMLHWYVYQK